MKIVLQEGLEAAQRAQAARLYWQAFGGKLGRVMGPAPKALAFIERVIDPAHVIVATEAGSGVVLGVIGFRTPKGSFVGGGQGDLIAIYGRFGAFWRALALARLAKDLPEGAISVDGLVVAEPVRGLGLGGALLDALCRAAAARGFAVVRLEVVGENLRARALYDRLGFAVTGRADRLLTEVVFGYRTALAMERRLGA